MSFPCQTAHIQARRRNNAVGADSEEQAAFICINSAMHNMMNMNTIRDISGVFPFGNELRFCWIDTFYVYGEMQSDDVWR